MHFSFFHESDSGLPGFLGGLLGYQTIGNAKKSPGPGRLKSGIKELKDAVRAGREIRTPNRGCLKGVPGNTRPRSRRPGAIPISPWVWSVETSVTGWRLKSPAGERRD